MADQSAGADLSTSPPPDAGDEINDSLVANPDPSSSDTVGGGNDATNPESITENDALPAGLQADAPIASEEAESHIPQKKDATLRELLGKLDDYAPIVGLSVYYLTP